MCEQLTATLFHLYYRLTAAVKQKWPLARLEKTELTNTNGWLAIGELLSLSIHANKTLQDLEMEKNVPLQYPKEELRYL